MLKIAVIDTNQRKFTTDMMEHWIAQGHQVKFFGTCRRPHMEWADVLWFDCVDGNLVASTKKAPELTKGKYVIARAIDIDVWACHFNAVDWSRVHHLIFIADHIRDFMMEEKGVKHKAKCHVHTIPCGVNLEKFTMRRCPEWNNNVAIVARMWYGKGISLMLQLIAALPEFHFHICGKWGLAGIERGWYKHYIDDFLSRYDNWTHVAEVADMNEWLEDKAFITSCSLKEAFGYSIAEGMAKGLKPIVHNFYGAEHIWPAKYRWDTIKEAVDLFRSDYQPFEYREFVRGTYPLSRMLESFDTILGGCDCR